MINIYMTGYFMTSETIVMIITSRSFTKVTLNKRGKKNIEKDLDELKGRIYLLFKNLCSFVSSFQKLRG